MHIDYKAQSANQEDSKCQNGTLEVSLEELAIINILLEEPTAIQKRIQLLCVGRAWSKSCVPIVTHIKKIPMQRFFVAF